MLLQRCQPFFWILLAAIRTDSEVAFQIKIRVEGYSVFWKANFGSGSHPSLQDNLYPLQRDHGAELFLPGANQNGQQCIEMVWFHHSSEVSLCSCQCFICLLKRKQKAI